MSYLPRIIDLGKVSRRFLISTFISILCLTIQTKISLAQDAKVVFEGASNPLTTMLITAPGFVGNDVESYVALKADATHGLGIGAIFSGPYADVVLDGPNGIISSDFFDTDGDITIRSNNNVIIQLDDRKIHGSVFQIFNSAGNERFSVDELGIVRVNGSIEHMSDINRKENIRLVSNQEILEKMSRLNMYTWSYKEDDTIHLGPMAQDFQKYFGLGKDDTTISTIDADGVAMSCIKALYQENQELKTRVGKLEELLNTILTSEEEN